VLPGKKQKREEKSSTVKMLLSVSILSLLLVSMFLDEARRGADRLRRENGEGNLALFSLSIYSISVPSFLAFFILFVVVWKCVWGMND
jgi:hypothetical protein